MKEINREDERWAEGWKKGREEGERANGDDTVRTCNKWFFSTRQSIHLPKYCLRRWQLERGSKQLAQCHLNTVRWDSYFCLSQCEMFYSQHILYRPVGAVIYNSSTRV